MRIISNPSDKFEKFNQLYSVKTTGCWEWGGFVDKRSGYGYQRFDGKKWTVHRYSYFIHFGSFDKELCVCHSCDNRKCVNPDHLFLGTHKDNVRDMINKGRQHRGDRNYNSESRTRETAEKIRGVYKNGGITQRQLAEKFKMSKSNIGAILLNQLWKVQS